MNTETTTLKFNQISIVTITTLAVLTQTPWLLACLAAILLLGSWRGEIALFKQLWQRGLRRALGVKPQVVEDDPRAHNFAQTVGGIVLALAALASFAGAPLIGTVLAITVIALALLNLTTHICVGCLLYFQYKMLRFRLRTSR
ncbi:DUF4395 domain-containing protein [Deinococcus peraridilitoris]|uniref:DUF4395 domain-containing protein n=1 Tax=Deinococcus peraridilitoris (strain DSM 19664 / LMG 22246 / CIP 109416 / KR-200) TaxID=937777 RepID=L0A574_DEIPD|nr:DUF4395 domain-containing protein [Deinococcus peraridilitoris]AFZ69038.1 hypothetical protein Deipe_3610 [Deinococcus peraridilitoris DSM 19664]